MFARRSVVLAAWALSFAGGAPLLAQAVRGTVTDRGTGAALPGVVVLLMDSTGNIVGRALAGERGSYEVSASRAGTYRLRTLRIGFRPTTSAPLRLGEGERMIHPLELAAIPVSLDTIRVVDRSPCRVLRDSAAITYGIWEQVRTAFMATELTARARMYETTIVTYERQLEPDGERVLLHNAMVRSGVTSAPWIARDSLLLRRSGYVVRDADRSTTYYAPDLNILLSGMFVQDHCFALRADEKRVGIAFEPTRDRKNIPEIEGTVWLDRKTSELQRLELQYVNVAQQLAAGRAGAEMEFARMANGAWMITRWHIRMPMLESRVRTTGVAGVRRAEGEVSVTEIRVEGGELALAKRGNDTLWSRPPMVVAGTVVDSTTGVALAGARVTVTGTQLGAVSDSAGRFSIPGLLPGEYTLAIRTPALDILNVSYHTPLALADNLKPIRLAVPSALQLARCGGEGKQSMVGMLVGTVRMRGDTVLPPNVLVVAEWDRAHLGDVVPRATQEAQGRRVQGRTSASGLFRLCDVPLHAVVTVRARSDSAVSDPKEIEVPLDSRVGRVDLFLGGDRNPSGLTSFSGRVFVDSTERPIAGAEVLLPTLTKSTFTDDSGAFQLRDIPAGEHEVIVRRMGYLPLATRLVFTSREPLVHQIFLSKVMVLDTIAVSATRVMADFEDNRRLGLGHFLTRAELAKVEHLSIATILSQVPGLRIVGSANRAWPASTRISRLMSPPILDDLDVKRGAMPGLCYAQVYLDNAVVYRGRPGEPLFDLSTVNAAAIEAIEYYASPSQIPARYSNVNSTCGVLVIWTRRSP